MAGFDPSSPHYADANGNHVHIGDYVFYTSRGSNGAITKSGMVEQITFKRDSTSVKVSRRAQFIDAIDTTLIGESTLEDRLRKLVASSNGLVDEDAIAELAEAVCSKAVK